MSWTGGGTLRSAFIRVIPLYLEFQTVDVGSCLTLYAPLLFAHHLLRTCQCISYTSWPSFDRQDR